MAIKKRVLERHYAIEAAYNTDWAAVRRNAQKESILRSIDFTMQELERKWGLSDEFLDELVKDSDPMVSFLARVIITLLILIGHIYDEMDR